MDMSVPAQVLIASIPLVAVVLLAILTFFYMLWDYKKNKLILERGETPVPRNLDDKIMLVGFVSFFVGIGLLSFFILTGGLSDNLLGGLIPTMAGLGIVLYYFLQGRKK